jgi:hypothetical protein
VAYGALGALGLLWVGAFAFALRRVDRVGRREDDEPWTEGAPAPTQVRERTPA